MFIKISNKKELLKELKQHQEEKIIVHYNCSDCDDEQVTHELEFDERMFETLEKEDCLYVMFPCTECGFPEKFIRISHIQGIEL